MTIFCISANNISKIKNLPIVPNYGFKFQGRKGQEKPNF